MKYSTLFFVFLSFAPCFSHCNWASRFSAMGRTVRSYATRHVNKKFKTTFQIPAQSHQLTRYADKKVYPYFTTASIILGSSTLNTSYCEENAEEVLFEHFGDMKNVDKDKLLITAAFHGHLDEVRYLHNHGADIDGGSCKAGPLVMAARNGHHSVVEFLCSNGADPNAKDMRTYGEVTALQLAYSRGDEEMMKILCDAGAQENEELRRRKMEDFGIKVFVVTYGGSVLAAIALCCGWLS